MAPTAGQSPFGIKLVVAQLLTETVLLATFSCLIVLSTYLLCTRQRSKSNVTLLSVTLCMYIAAGFHWGATLYEFTFFLDGKADLADPARMPNKVVMIFVQISLNVNLILSDFIVAWRTWLLYERRRSIMLCAGACALATVALAIISLALTEILAFKWVPYGTWTSDLTTGVSLALNVGATVLVTQLKDGTHRTRAYMTLLLLAEAGGMYCVYW
ncbi:hypothetical protein FA95DRAFT_1576822, partial [Auriscalpium vulgare]